MKRILTVVRTIASYAFYYSINNRDKAQYILFNNFYRLGGIYIKFLQILAMHQDKQEIELSSLKNALSVFDNNEYENIDIHKLMSTELGQKSLRISNVSSTPIAAGSFAQVYEALVNNQQVVIKVLKPSITKNLNFDLKVLIFASRVISLFMRGQMIDFAQIIDDLKRVTLKETDYFNEVKNAIELKNKLVNNKVIYIPKTYKELSTRHIIIQEKINGLPVTSLLDSDITDKVKYVKENLMTDLNFVMEELAMELIEGSLSSAGTYGDPHPGNVYILTNNRIGLIDFGIGLPSHKNKAGFVHLLSQYSALYNGAFNPSEFSKAMIRYFVPDLTQSLQTISTYFEKQDLVNKVLNEIGQTVSQTIEQQSDNYLVGNLISQYRMMYLLTNIVNNKNRLGLKLTIEQPEFLRSTNIFLNMVHLLGCDKKLLGNAFKNATEKHQELLTNNQPEYDIESIDGSLYCVASWFERLQQSDPNLYTRLVNSWSNA